MKLFFIKSDSCNSVLAYLIYYQKEKQFFIELPDNADPWETPILLSKFAERGETTIDHYWSGLWVNQRIIPTDRQNLGQILRENGMKNYDEYELLTCAKGRCAQDDYYIKPINEEDIPKEIKERFQMKVADIMLLDGYRAVIFFRDNSAKVCDIMELMKNNASFVSLMNTDEGMFGSVKIMTGGYGLQWEDSMTVTYDKLYKGGDTCPVRLSDIGKFIAERTVNSTEASEILKCSRQNINDLVTRGTLSPIKETEKNKMFFKSSIASQKWI